MIKYPSDIVTISVPVRVLDSALNQVKAMLPIDLYEHFKKKEKSLYELLQEPDWAISKTKSGRWHTRLKRRLYKEGYKLSDDLVSKIGEVVDRHTTKGRSFTLFFAKDMVPAQFDASYNSFSYNGIPGWSCWREKYNDNYRLSKRFFRSGGRCIRIYENEKAWFNNPWEGIGRAFCIEQKDMLLLFNLKGDGYTRSELVEALRSMFGYEYGSSWDILPPMGYLDNEYVLSHKKLDKRIPMKLKELP